MKKNFTRFKNWFFSVSISNLVLLSCAVGFVALLIVLIYAMNAPGRISISALSSLIVFMVILPLLTIIIRKEMPPIFGIPLKGIIPSIFGWLTLISILVVWVITMLMQ